VRLCARIAKICSTHVPLATFFQAPTVAQLASLLRQTGWSASPSALLAVRPTGSKPPFFSVYLAGSFLARYVEDQPCYGLHSQVMDGQPSPATVEAIAAQHLAEIQTIQPTGPYFLSGYSFGGLIAFEMAQQLRQQGQDVALLFLIEPTSPCRSSAAADSLWKQLKGMARRLVRLLGECFLVTGRPLPLFLRRRYFNDVSIRAAQRYKPQVYPGRVTLFCAATPDTTLQHVWRNLAAGGLELHEVPGDHWNLFQEPHIHILAACLRQALEVAHALALAPGTRQ
jgi:thioesterase domain-containing protein